MDVCIFYFLPGIRIDEDCLSVKSAWSATDRTYQYRDVVGIRQMTITGKKHNRYSLELELADGSCWRTAEVKGAGIPNLTRTANWIEQKSKCPIFPVFEQEHDPDSSA
jgi:hypothetical protein